MTYKEAECAVQNLSAPDLSTANNKLASYSYLTSEHRSAKRHYNKWIKRLHVFSFMHV